MYNNKPIGIFDSGIGGTSIWAQIHELLPNESTIYLADSLNAPYGEKSKNEIQALCFKNTDLLLEMECKLIVVACNTATTNAIKELRLKYSVPFIGIEPAIKPAAILSKTQTIGILATQGTLNSTLFHETASQFTNIKIIEQVGHGLVSLIENGKINSDEMTYLLHSYLDPMIQSNIDFLVLGCSHYPYLIPQIRKILPKNIHIIDSGEAVARQTKNVLKEKVGISSFEKGESLFFTNSETKVLSDILENKFEVYQREF